MSCIYVADGASVVRAWCYAVGCCESYTLPGIAVKSTSWRNLKNLDGEKLRGGDFAGRCKYTTDGAFAAGEVARWG